MKYLKTFEDFVNESNTNEAKTNSLDLSAKENVFALRDKLPAKYRKNFGAFIYDTPKVSVSHGAILSGMPSKSRVIKYEKMAETYRGSEDWTILTSIAIIEHIKNIVTFAIVYDEFDPIKLDEIKKDHPKLYSQETYTDEKDLLKKIQSWYSYTDKVFKEVMDDKR